jgi:hypothetical protein
MRELIFTKIKRIFANIIFHCKTNANLTLNFVEVLLIILF